ncbi:MAG: hypothetical protein MZV64_15575 [Ignavibacteriales bacterium]|nr:hypothetical protein [Ignavibacteriales bacterium]
MHRLTADLAATGECSADNALTALSQLPELAAGHRQLAGVAGDATIAPPDWNCCLRSLPGPGMAGRT